MTRARKLDFVPLATGLSICLSISLWLSPSASSQVSAGHSAASFQFNLSNPGARSLGMGGAFVGLADDATAAYANPAGLTVLARPEVSFEGRTAAFRLPLVAAEPIVNLAISSGQDLTGETIFETAALTGVAELTSLGAPDATGTNASFASLVYPTKAWTFALYRHQLVDLDAAGVAVLPAITTAALDNLVTTEGSTRTRVRLDISSMAFAAARRIGERFSAGLTLVRNQASIEAHRISRFEERFEGRFSGTASFGFENLVESRDSDLTLNAGLLFRPYEDWAIGLSWRQGPRFEISSVDTTTTSSGQVRAESFGEDFRVPGVSSLGVSFQATPQIVASIEWDHVGYSSLSHPTTLPDSLASFAERDNLNRLGAFAIEDVDEYRAGMEYTKWRSTLTPSLRLGVWYDPGHKVRFDSLVACPENGLLDNGFECMIGKTNASGPLAPGLLSNLEAQVSDATAAHSLELLFPAGKNLVHFTGGVGVVLGSRVQLDTAFDYVDSDQYIFSLSGIIQF